LPQARGQFAAHLTIQINGDDSQDNETDQRQLERPSEPELPAQDIGFSFIFARAFSFSTSHRDDLKPEK
jgi:hypothetical protein